MKKQKATTKPGGGRLKLDKEKVRELQSDELADVAGGACAKSYGCPSALIGH